MQEMRKNTRLIRGFVGVAIVLAVLGLDQLSKQLVAANMEIGQSVVLIPGVLRLTYITNPAAAMGLFGNARWLFMILSPLVVIAIIVYLFLAKKLSRLYTAALAMIAGGGFGNMIDRTFYGDKIGYGEVVDFVDFIAFPKVWTYIFNIADAFVCVGAGLFILAMILDWIRESREKKKQPAGIPDESAERAESSEEQIAPTEEQISPDSEEISEKTDENGTKT